MKAPPRRPAQRLTLLEIMVLIAGLAVGLWLMAGDVPSKNESWADSALLVVACVLGGLSLVGPPLLLREVRRRRRPWGPGKLVWFSQGMASWLLWPPVVVQRFQGRKMGDTQSGACYAYGTPLMALYVTIALLAGGWLGRRRLRRAPRSWRERFGLLLGMAWACTGAYVLYLLYRADFGR
jgi:hypothetical protein